MATILVILRSLIQDVAGGKYTDSELNQLITIAAIRVLMEIHFDQIYTVDVLAKTITPDPTDLNFINFVAQKAAIILTQSEMKTAASYSIRLQDGPSQLDTTQLVTSLKTLLAELNSTYDKNKVQYQVSGGSTVHVITTPTTSEMPPERFA